MYLPVEGLSVSVSPNGVALVVAGEVEGCGAAVSGSKVVNVMGASSAMACCDWREFECFDACVNGMFVSGCGVEAEVVFVPVAFLGRRVAGRQRPTVRPFVLSHSRISFAWFILYVSPQEHQSFIHLAALHCLSLHLLL